jgi:tRNA G26 N,N-dimethylase Trm1
VKTAGENLKRSQKAKPASMVDDISENLTEWSSHFDYDLDNFGSKKGYLKVIILDLDIEI